MKIIHSIQNKEVLAAPSLSTAFSRNRINKSLYVSSLEFFLADVWKIKGSSVYRIKGKITLESKEKYSISKVIIYFPESNYSLERIAETEEYEIEFIHQNKVTRDYFNIVIFDKDNFVISSSTYVFDDNRVVEHPIQEKDMSDLQAKNSLTETSDSIVLETAIEKDLEHPVEHIWQNIGQHYRIEKPTKKNSNTYVSSVSKKSMCSGVWMVIVTDKFGKLVTQYIITI